MMTMTTMTMIMLFESVSESQMEDNGVEIDRLATRMASSFYSKLCLDKTPRYFLAATTHHRACDYGYLNEYVS